MAPNDCKDHDKFIALEVNFENLKKEVDDMQESIKEVSLKIDNIANKIMVWTGIGIGISTAIGIASGLISTFLR